MSTNTAAPVRKTDPATSHLAAATMTPRLRSTIRSRVLAILTAGNDGEGMTHDALIAAYKKYAVRLGWPRAADSSIRTRCNELWRDGEVERVEGTAGKSGMGHAAILWRAVSVQNKKTGKDMEETA
ncbi:helix-turn-helix DNA-binding domain protein [Arthrobacter phage Galaxy]|uniref:Helix-turn-helix DNA-binding domain protein n=1 Tax=Arthrobacter phage Galaxy TaxID=1772326 RepID=A0A0U4JGB1_9CAUD|nr:DNA binding protein [Arthrobacter phage Galaxy]ALY08884.1 helix-turn-helix DNA-binding domain protein [Arthrobacter phage Galaxy]